MKRYILAMIILGLGAVVARAEVAERRLPTEVVPPRGSATSTLWNLSDVLSTDADGVSYRIYGDTLVSEQVDRIRNWYAADSSGLVRIEGLLWRVSPLGAVEAGRWGAAPVEAETQFRGAVDRESMAADTLACRLRRAADRAGRIVLPGPDTIRAIERTELLAVTDAAGEFVQTTRRWFSAGDRSVVPMPLAVAVTRTYGGRTLSETAFVADSRDMAPADVPDDMPALDALAVRLDSRILTIADNDGALSAPAAVDVTDLAGRSYARGSLSAGGSATIDLGALPCGSYLAVITSGAAQRKIPLQL